MFGRDADSNAQASQRTELAAHYLMPETDDDEDPAHLILMAKRRRTVVDYKVWCMHPSLVMHPVYCCFDDSHAAYVYSVYCHKFCS